MSYPSIFTNTTVKKNTTLVKAIIEEMFSCCPFSETFIQIYTARLHENIVNEKQLFLEYHFFTSYAKFFS